MNIIPTEIGWETTPMEKVYWRLYDKVKGTTIHIFKTIEPELKYYVIEEVAEDIKKLAWTAEQIKQRFGFVLPDTSFRHTFD